MWPEKKAYLNLTRDRGLWRPYAEAVTPSNEKGTSYAFSIIRVGLGRAFAEPGMAFVFAFGRPDLLAFADSRRLKILSKMISDVTQGSAARLMRRVLRELGKPSVSHDMHSLIVTLIDRMLLTVRKGRSCGITAWGTRAAQEFGAAQAVKLGMCVAEAIAAEAAFDGNDLGMDPDRVNVSLQGSVARIARAAATFEAGMFPGGFADSDAGFAALAAMRQQNPQSRRHLVAVGLWVRRLCAKLQLSPQAAAMVEACAALREIATQNTTAASAQDEGVPLESRIAAVMDAFSAAIRDTPEDGPASARRIIEGLQHGVSQGLDPEALRWLLGIVGLVPGEDGRNAP